MHGRKSHGTRPWPSQRQPKARWYQETASLAIPKASHVRFILGNPCRQLFLGKLARLRQPDTLRAQSGRKKEHQFLFLLWRQSLRRLNFFKFAHALNYHPASSLTTHNPLARGVLAKDTKTFALASSSTQDPWTADVQPSLQKCAQFFDNSSRPIVAREEKETARNKPKTRR